MIYTSYFSKIRQLQKAYPNMLLLSIAGNTPTWFTGQKLQALAPKYSWWKKWHDEKLPNSWYRGMYYNTVLCNIDAKQTADIISKMSNGNDACLMCFESSEKFCHRHIVAEWLTDNGVPCKELYVNSCLQQLDRANLQKNIHMMKACKNYVVNDRYICKATYNISNLFSEWRKLDVAKDVIFCKLDVEVFDNEDYIKEKMSGEITLFDNNDINMSSSRCYSQLYIADNKATIEIKSFDEI